MQRITDLTGKSCNESRIQQGDPATNRKSTAESVHSYSIHTLLIFYSINCRSYMNEVLHRLWFNFQTMNFTMIKKSLLFIESWITGNDLRVITINEFIITIQKISFCLPTHEKAFLWLWNGDTPILSHVEMNWFAQKNYILLYDNLPRLKVKYLEVINSHVG